MRQWFSQSIAPFIARAAPVAALSWVVVAALGTFGEPPDAGAASPRRGARLFQARCAGCHTVTIEALRLGNPQQVRFNKAGPRGFVMMHAAGISAATDITAWSRRQTPRRTLA